MMDARIAAGLLMKKGTPRPGLNTSTPKMGVWLKEFRSGAHEPVVDRATWDAYVAARRARTKTRTGSKSTLPSGLLWCGECGAQMHGAKVAGQHGFYRCARGGTLPSAHGIQISQDLVDAAVEAWVLDFADSISAQREAQRQTAGHRERVEVTARRAQQQLKRVEERLVSLTLEFVDDAIPADVYQRTRATPGAERTDAERRVESATRNPVQDAARRPCRPICAASGRA